MYFVKIKLVFKINYLKGYFKKCFVFINILSDFFFVRGREGGMLYFVDLSK